MIRRILLGAVVATIGVLGAAPAGAVQGSGADLAVAIRGQGSVLLPGARYTVSVTNHGPEALTGATVVVRLDPRVMEPATGQPCPYDAESLTLTCTFGAVAVGATASMYSSVYYLLRGEPTEVLATATRVASTPADPEPANDSATRRCWYSGYQGFPPPPGPPMTC